MPDTFITGRPALGLLVLRLGAGAMLLFGHGLSKLMTFDQRRTTFADPIGIGPLPGLVLTVFAEVFCSIAVMLGLFTRLAAIPPLIVMLVAFFIVHAGDPWRTRELPLLFAVPFLALCFTGPGAFSLDAWLAGRRRR
jgi:putative oxidoreductase